MLNPCMTLVLTKMLPKGQIVVSSKCDTKRSQEMGTVFEKKNVFDYIRQCN